MTNEEMRKAIAKHLGWKLYQFNFAMRSWVALKEPGFDPGKLDQASEAFEVGWESCEYLPFSWDGVPNWPEDLNAMREAEKAAFKSSTLWLEFACNILSVLKAADMSVTDGMTCVLQATAAQRAEAFLRTVGKWRDE